MDEAEALVLLLLPLEELPLRIVPNNFWVHQGVGVVLVGAGRVEGGLHYVSRAQTMLPLDHGHRLLWALSQIKIALLNVCV